MSAGKSANTRSYNCNALVAACRGGQLFSFRIMPHAEVVAVGGVPLQRADASQHIGEWIGRASEKIGFLILRNADGLHVAPALRMNRTGGLARNILVEIFPVRNCDGIAHALPISTNPCNCIHETCFALVQGRECMPGGRTVARQAERPLNNFFRLNPTSEV